MNGAQQQERATQIQRLDKLIEELAKAMDAEVADRDLKMREFVREMVGEERTHRLKLAEEQRTYVDQQIKEVKQQNRAVVEEFLTMVKSAVDGASADIGKRLDFYENLGFWARFRFLFTGRL